MRVLLVSPIKNSYMGILKHPQLGLGYLATAARRHGHDVSLLDCLNLKLSQAAFSPFHPYPGTAIFEQLRREGELSEDFDFSGLRTDNVIYSPRGITKKRLARLRKYVILRFYFRPWIMMGLLTNYNTFRFALVKFLQIFIIRKEKIKIREKDVIRSNELR